MDYKCKNTYMTRRMEKGTRKNRFFRKESKDQRVREQGKNMAISTTRRFVAVDRMDEEECMLADINVTI